MSITQDTIPGGWTQREVRVGPRRFQLIVPANPDAFLHACHDQTAQDGHHDMDPYWAQLWPAALPTAKVVLEAKWPAGTKALELGCGIGLVGLAALASGLDVTFSDHCPTAVSLAIENARRNGFTTAKPLVMDWRKPRAERFPVILAADILYEQKSHQPILNLLNEMLTDNGVCWIGDPCRYHSPSFLQAALDCKFAIHVQDETKSNGGGTMPPHFQLLLLRRPPSSEVVNAPETLSRAFKSAVFSQAKGLSE